MKYVNGSVSLEQSKVIKMRLRGRGQQRVKQLLKIISKGGDATARFGYMTDNPSDALFELELV
jgi:hypothetical protein